MPDLYLQLDDETGEETPVAALSEREMIDVLTCGQIVGQKLIPWGSNYSFASAVEDDDGREVLAIYKPAGGENPLWDFPDGTLYQREVAAFELVRMLGWPVIPPTVIHDGPMGLGSLQLYRTPCEPDPDADSAAFWGTKELAIEQIVLFDHIANNADRKLAHLLLDTDGRAWGIDHGLTFNVDPKLKTVLWQFVGEAVRPQLIEDLRRIREEESTMRAILEPLINESELIMLILRIEEFLDNPVYPILNPQRNIPYGWW